MKRWHTNKTSPKCDPEQTVIMIFCDKSICATYFDIDSFGDKVFCIGDTMIPWKDYKDKVIFWACCDKYFEKELSKFEKKDFDWYEVLC